MNRADSMAEGYSFRRIQKKDYKGVTETLKVLTEVGQVSAQQFESVVDHWNSIYVSEGITQYNPYVLVEDKTGEIAATGNIILERKLIHECALCGHIEDIAVSSNHQGKKLGKLLIEKLTQIGIDSGCYKIILDCDKKNAPFYEKCGYSNAGIEMQLRLK